MQTAVAIAVADDKLPTGGNIVFKVDADSGKITDDDATALGDLLEDGASFQVEGNQGLGTLTWKIDATGITSAPTINDDGEITDAV